MVEESKVHIKFGLIADVQYADADDGYNFSKTRRRYYRAALDLLKKAVWDWKSQHAELDFVVQLGDIIDGVNKRQGGENAANIALELSLEPFKELNCSTFHVIGNHDLYNFTKSYLLRSMLNSSKLPNVLGVDDKLYYAAIVHPYLKVIVLDTYDISVLGYEDQQEHTGYSLALDVLDKNNPNEEKNSLIGLKGYDARFAAYNGGISTQQLMWFDAQLAEADASKQNVIVCSHIQLYSVPQDADCLVWNYQDVLAVLHSYNCVVLCVAGHDHDGSLTIDTAGIHHLVLNGVIETLPNSNAYATALLHDSALEIKGRGVVPSICLPLKYCISTCDVKGDH